MRTFSVLFLLLSFILITILIHLRPLIFLLIYRTKKQNKKETQKNINAVQEQ